MLNGSNDPGYRTGDNPARWKGHLSEVLPTGDEIGAVVHHAAMPVTAAVPVFIQALQQRHLPRAPGPSTATNSTASRTGEVLKARWNEIDFQNWIWTRPASHMKAGIEHKVPLTARMIQILKGLPR